MKVASNRLLFSPPPACIPRSGKTVLQRKKRNDKNTPPKSSIPRMSPREPKLRPVRFVPSPRKIELANVAPPPGAPFLSRHTSSRIGEPPGASISVNRANKSSAMINRTASIVFPPHYCALCRVLFFLFLFASCSVGAYCSDGDLFVPNPNQRNRCLWFRSIRRRTESGTYNSNGSAGESEKAWNGFSVSWRASLLLYSSSQLPKLFEEGEKFASLSRWKDDLLSYNVLGMFEADSATTTPPPPFFFQPVCNGRYFG